MSHGPGQQVPPGAQPQGQQPQTPQQVLASIPTYRRSGVASALLLVALAAAFLGPYFLGPILLHAGTVVFTLIGLLLGAPLLAVCVIVLTGDIYYDTFDAQGQIKKWGVANKVVAGLILAAWAYSIIRAFL